MECTVAISEDRNLEIALSEVVRSLQKRPLSGAISLAMVFVSPAYGSALDDILPGIQKLLNAEHVLGATGETIIADGREVESSPALAIWVGTLPGSRLTPIRVEFEQTADGIVCLGLPDDLSQFADPEPTILLLAEPFSCQPRVLLDLLESELPETGVIGGLASGGNPGENRVLLNNTVYDTGAVGLIIQEGPKIDAVVSQGARPIGQPFVVTRAERHLIYELGGVPPLERLSELFPTLSERDQRLFEEGLLFGIARTEYRDRFESGDFLISGVVGADRETGALAIGNLVRAGQTVQFHLRDADAADVDLTRLLENNRRKAGLCQGALLFSCNGRGTRMFAGPDHDAKAIQGVFGPLPLAGMFAQGEIGPVGGRNYVHGFTASVALFRDRSADEPGG